MTASGISNSLVGRESGLSIGSEVPAECYASGAIAGLDRERHSILGPADDLRSNRQAELEIGPEEAAEQIAARGAADRRPPGLRMGCGAHPRRQPRRGEPAHRRGGFDPDRPIVFQCRSGSRSALATQVFRASGFEAHNIAGGLTAWVESGLELEPEDGTIAEPRPPSGLTPSYPGPRDAGLATPAAAAGPRHRRAAEAADGLSSRSPRTHTAPTRTSASTGSAPGSPRSSASSASAPTPSPPPACSRSRPRRWRSSSPCRLQEDSATKGDVQNLRGQLGAVEESASEAAQDDLASITDRLDSLEGQVSQLERRPGHRPRTSSRWSRTTSRSCAARSTTSSRRPTRVAPPRAAPVPTVERLAHVGPLVAISTS